MRFAGDRRPEVEAKHASARQAMRQAKATAKGGGRQKPRQNPSGQPQIANGPFYGRVIGGDQ